VFDADDLLEFTREIREAIIVAAREGSTDLLDETPTRLEGNGQPKLTTHSSDRCLRGGPRRSTCGGSPPGVRRVG